MRPELWFLPVAGIIGLAITMPGWDYFLGTFSDQPAHVQFLATLTLPTLVALLVGSWMEPR